jgi:hypothetical protein
LSLSALLSTSTSAKPASALRKLSRDSSNWSAIVLKKGRTVSRAGGYCLASMPWYKVLCLPRYEILYQGMMLCAGYKHFMFLV